MNKPIYLNGWFETYTVHIYTFSNNKSGFSFAQFRRGEQAVAAGRSLAYPPREIRTEKQTRPHA